MIGCSIWNLIIFARNSLYLRQKKIHFMKNIGCSRSLFKLPFLLIISLLTSCVSNRNIAYFQDLSGINDSVLDSTAKFIEPRILPDDILSISIITADPQTSALVNQSSSLQVVGAASNLGRQEIDGFLVDNKGEIELAVVGKIKVAGLTTSEARELLRERVSKDFKDPKISVRFANFKISVLGEVNKPAAYSLPNEKVSVLDVLSLAGDLTIYGKRENVLVIRDVDGRKEMGRLNLNSVELFSSPFFYLRQNDVIYVEQSKSRISTLNAPVRTNISIALSAISVIAIAFSRVF
jgi:polysaccharide export outer membrane protein